MDIYQGLSVGIATLAILIPTIIAILRVSTRTKVEIARIETFMTTKFSELEKSDENMQKELDRHQILNEKQFEIYHNETREDFKSINDKLTKLQDLIIDNIVSHNNSPQPVKRRRS